jgi:hypothetical protein
MIFRWLTLALAAVALVPLDAQEGVRGPAGILELARTSEFIGFVDGYPIGMNSDPVWKRWISVTRVDSIKGNLGRGPGTNRYPYVGADRLGESHYPTWFDRHNEYLVFLRHDVVGGKSAWATNAAFLIEYRPDSAGMIVGKLDGREPGAAALGISAVRALLRRIVTGDRASEAALVLDPVLNDAASSRQAIDARRVATFEERWQRAKALADAIRVGTRRADVEKIFREEDGGLSGPGSTRYYEGEEVMVEVPFDQRGGPWNSDNRVTGPLRVYRSRRHLN